MVSRLRMAFTLKLIYFKINYKKYGNRLPYSIKLIIPFEILLMIYTNLA